MNQKTLTIYGAVVVFVVVIVTLGWIFNPLRIKTVVVQYCSKEIMTNCALSDDPTGQMDGKRVVMRFYPNIKTEFFCSLVGGESGYNTGDFGHGEFIGCAPKVEESPIDTITKSIERTRIEYRNSQFGFIFMLPKNWEGFSNWEGYSIVTDKWHGNTIDGTNPVSIEGPQIVIRHPQWTVENPRQDIPIMIFTLAQWELIQQEKLSVGAAPIGPSELGRNANYVFALPARYNYAFPTGFEEVEKILQDNPLQAF